ncbi:DUF692 family protein [Photorhabdus kleinii]|uniref:multinuclear nonheme iron-dependent oxidase n=1 Tax=Photorhabdus kleinii TaxID=768034 RepID=UPI0021D4E981|nr:DUF692 family multinuclear iron-containing protein [Photorhabdus kleinii]MCT8342866.1 DUF692 family protein [Photorhabdus kleinii]
MQIGTNWFGNRELSILKEIISLRKVDFIEILIDNFLQCSPDSILDISKGLPIAFHIMNSKYMHRSKQDLESIGKRIRVLQKELNPIYISDHVGVFYHNSYPLPTMGEVDYSSEKDKYFDSVSLWQDIIGEKIYLENFPSILDENARLQPDFFKEMTKKCGNGLLFDISNAVIAQENTGTPFEEWLDIEMNHLHIGGYAETSLRPSFLVDTHADRISNLSLEYFNKLGTESKDNLTSLSVERDDNFVLGDWINDIELCRQ